MIEFRSATRQSTSHSAEQDGKSLLCSLYRQNWQVLAVFLLQNKLAAWTEVANTWLSKWKVKERLETHTYLLLCVRTVLLTGCGPMLDHCGRWFRYWHSFQLIYSLVSLDLSEQQVWGMHFLWDIRSRHFNCLIFVRLTSSCKGKSQSSKVGLPPSLQPGIFVKGADNANVFSKGFFVISLTFYWRVFFILSRKQILSPWITWFFLFYCWMVNFDYVRREWYENKSSA